MYKKRILAISPHSDDIELGCGGYLKKLKDEGSEIATLLMVAKNENMIHKGSVVTAETRLNEYYRSTRLLGVDEARVMITDAADDFDLCKYSKSKAITYIDQVIAEFKPDTVLIPVPSFHQEHQYTYECGIAATRPTKAESSVNCVLAYEYPAANWGQSASLDPSKGGMYIDITDYIDFKLEVLSCHESQMYRGGRSLISMDGVRTLAKMRGLECSVDYAEMLYVLRMMG